MPKTTIKKAKSTKSVAKMSTKSVVKKKTEIKKDIALSGEALLSFISGTQTNIGKATFYNLADEQRQAMVDMHAPILQHARPFYALMSLSAGINDVNKSLIAWNLIETTAPAVDERQDINGLKHKFSQQSWWENEVILQSFQNMSVPRVFEFLTSLQERHVTKKRALYLIHEYLRRHAGSWALWAIKYRKDLKRVLRHAHIKSNIFTEQQKTILTKLWRYLKYNEHEGCPQLILDYIDVQNGNKEKLAKLPETVAEGFMTKFKMSREEFWKLFTTSGGQLTAKEQRTKATAASKAGSTTGFDMRKARLFDLLVYLHSLNRLPKSEDEIKDLLDKKAAEAANGIAFTLEDTAVILDTSISMQGTKEQPYHPMLRGVAISMVLKHVSNKFKEFRTNGGTELFPVLKNQSNYTDSLLQALKEGYKTIVVVGDAYENAPYENAFHQVLYAFKKKIDTENKVMILQFNPVFASEAMDVRNISPIASATGVREIGALNESMFLAVAKFKPMLAISKFLNRLVLQQNDRAKSLMPESVKLMIESGTKLLTQGG